MSNQKEEILGSFNSLLKQYELEKARVFTKEELAEQKNNEEVVKVAATYTSSAIVKNLAEMQLTFGNNLSEWGETLRSESDKEDEIKKALEVESERLKELHKIKLAADALFILKEENEKKKQELEKEFEDKISTVEEEKTTVKEEWEKEALESQKRDNDYELQRDKKRKEDSEEYQYEQENQSKKDTDDYEKRKMLSIRELEEESKQKEKDWQAREKVFADKKEDYDKDKKKLEEFSDLLKESVQKEKDQASKLASRDAKVKAELEEKEVEAKVQMNNMRIEELENLISKNSQTIEKLSGQLEAALSQAQDLSLRALENTRQGNLVEQL
ncbi:hypothetical protein [Aureibacter tunicatorum]|uniref:Myosin heavy subunit n=1 Tax=Aureibacter tunicatorum TaxID=866807 RepID=A0AAE3XL18_9BACT|nr:hypothetical protein [Aureibacter tunicatorum]MDR6238475.1 myosin heavy subunit [Aureibacter tunicatorum]BDD05592.1 hypothetical protein AUTU_30750 [Aureibacter tunicatorum]